jgi:prepilin-type N-terminal cleavage/methylation domain-containing protein
MSMIFRRRNRVEAFTLVEVVVSLAILGLMAGGILQGYLQSASCAEWQGRSSAAQSLAMQRVEQCRAAQWDTKAWPPIDNLVASNFPTVTEQLDMPMAGTNFKYATVYTTLSDLSANPPLRMIEADCVWQTSDETRFFTNTVVTYRAPDQ